MPEKMLEMWEKVIAVIVGGGASFAALCRWVAIPALDGRYPVKEDLDNYITKKDLENKCGTTSAAIEQKLDDLAEQVALNHTQVSTHMEDGNKKMEDGNKKFEKIDRCLQQILPKVGIDPDDIDKSIL